MVETAEHAYVTDLARTGVTALAPYELVFFDGLSEAYFRDSERVLAGPRRRDEILGSGLDTLETLLTPVALAVATSIYRHLLDRAGDAVVRAGERRLPRLRRALGGRRAAPAEAPSPDAPGPPLPDAAPDSPAPDSVGGPPASEAPETPETPEAAPGGSAGSRQERARTAATARALELGLAEDQARALVDTMLAALQAGE